MDEKSLKKHIESVHHEVVAWRRHFHQYPELSFHEHETAKYISEQLTKLENFQVSQPTKTSVVGRLKGKKGVGKTIAMRADIDALPIQENTNLPFSSKVDGVMHACGHDGHAAILLGTAKVLSQIHEELEGEFVFIFQHAEEVPPGGAREMVEAGVLDGVDYVLGLHLWATVPVGEIHITEGPITAASDIFDLIIEGKSGHASEPQSAIDTIAIGAQIITNLQQITSRTISPLDSAVISVTRFHSGDAYNVIADRAEIGGSVRTLTNDTRTHVKSQIEQIATNVAKAHHAKATLHYEYGYDPIINNNELTQKITEHTRKYFSDDKHIKIIKAPPMLGGEDFSAFSNEVAGCYIGIGALQTKNNEIYPHHHPKFDIDENAFLIALNYYVSVALHLANEN